MDKRYVPSYELAHSLQVAIQKYDIPFREGVVACNAVSTNPDVNRLFYSKTAVLSQDGRGVLNSYNLSA